jgi:hypothetical protein
MHAANDEAYWLYHDEPDVEVPDEREPDDNIPDAVQDGDPIAGWDIHPSMLDGRPAVTMRRADSYLTWQMTLDRARHLANAILSEIETIERRADGTADRPASDHG